MKINLENPIDKSLLNMFQTVQDECDSLEDIGVKQKLSGEVQTSSGIKFEFLFKISRCVK